MIQPAAPHDPNTVSGSIEPDDDRHASLLPAGDRRLWPRRDISLPGRWYADDRWVLVSIETLSPGGATVSALVSLAPGTRGLLRIELFDRDIESEVRWARATTAGVSFCLDAAERAALEDHLARWCDQCGLAMPLLPLVLTGAAKRGDP